MSNENGSLLNEKINNQENYIDFKNDPFNLHLENELTETDLENYDKLNCNVETFNLDYLGKVKHEYKLKGKIKDLKEENLEKLFIKNRILKKIDNLTPLQLTFLRNISMYKDLYLNECSFEDREQIYKAYSIHALNHVLKTRSRVLNNNSKIKKNKDLDLEFKDQGFTRPKVLILLPFRSSAYNVVNYIIELFSGDKSINNKESKKVKQFLNQNKRFKSNDQKKESLEKKVNDSNDDSSDEEFEINDEINLEAEEENDGVSNSQITVMNFKKFKTEFLKADNVPYKKPEDYKKIFSGNTNEYFRIGIEFTKKSCKLYARFYNSDIIIASPLGLMTIIGVEGDKKRDYDFLSSIELLILDQTEVFLMQNWEHVITIMKNLNLQPNDHHDTDFSRIRSWSLDGLSKYYRQTIVLSSIKSIFISSLFDKESYNYEGKLKQINQTLFKNSKIRQVLVPIEHRFQRFTSKSLADSTNSRFKFFVETILPKFNSSTIGHSLIYIPSYFDFIRLRNYMRKEEISFTQICEHTEQGKMAQARKRFFVNQRTFLLYTERAHFYNRFSIKGIHHLIFYQLPTFPNFYNELCSLLIEENQRKNFIDDGKTFDCTVVFDKFDSLQLSQIIGVDKTQCFMNSFLSLNTIKNLN